MPARNEQSAERPRDVAELRIRPLVETPREPETRTIVIRQSNPWQSLAFLCLCLLLLGAVLLGHRYIAGLERKNQEMAQAIAGFERKVEQVESGLTFDARRRYLLLGMRNHILKVNPKVSLSEAYRYAQLAVEAGEKYPSVDPLLMLALGTIESGYDVRARSRADARGLYQIWPATGRLLLRALGWTYDDDALFDPEKNTHAAALYLDILFSTYSDAQLVLAEYNGGPLNAGYFRAGAGALASETRAYVPKVLQLHNRLREQFDKGNPPHFEASGESQRDGKTLSGR